MSDELHALATRAWIYGYPLVFDLDEVRRCTEVGFGAVPAAPFNTWAHARSLATDADTFVTVNNDTLYSLAQLDLSVGPIVLRVPDAGDRYYVLQHVDAWTNNFAYVGTRGTGNGAGSFVLVPPTWDGPLPEGATPIQVPTTVGTIVGRWAVDGAADLPAVHALQDRLVLEPVDASATPAGLPTPTPDVPEELAFWERLRVALAAFPPPARDADLQPLGLLDATSPYVDAGPDLRAALVAGADAGLAVLEQQSRAASSTGWSSTTHVFDYNLDALEVGTIDTDEWKIADERVRLVTRALAARVGLWGNHGYEAAYAVTFVDGDGAPLDGANRYHLRLDPTPPVEAFWSVTMYDADDYYLVANPIDRFSIGDRTPGLVQDDDGAVTLVIQHDEPEDPAERANWLPAPAGTFRPTARMYVPKAALLDGSYQLPAVERVG